MNIREIILDILMELSRENVYCHLLLRDVLKKYNYLEARDKAFIKKVVEGVIERKIELDYVINLFSKIKVNKMKPLILEVLRMSIYQILYMEQVPDSAICNEAVKLVEKRKFSGLKGFVNGVLRNIARNKDSISYENMSVKYSMPQWIVDHLTASYGKEKAEMIMAAFLKEQLVSIRMKESLSKERVNEIRNDLETAGIVVTKQKYLPYAYTLKKSEGLSNVPAFLNGDFTVQDISSMLVAECANVQKGDTVLDLCAAPGGKSMHIAEKLNGSGKVYAFDVSERKVAYLEENRARLGYQNVDVAVKDATIFDKNYVEKGDVVLADVPCSGLGVIGKKCDIKYRIDEDEITKIVELQKKIIDNAWRYVKKGGTLIYSTCTISHRENEEMLDYIVENTALKLESIEAYIPKELHCDTTNKGYLQLLPGVHECDGFFIARLKRED